MFLEINNEFQIQFDKLKFPLFPWFVIQIALVIIVFLLVFMFAHLSR